MFLIRILQGQGSQGCLWILWDSIQISGLGLNSEKFGIGIGNEFENFWDWDSLLCQPLVMRVSKLFQRITALTKKDKYEQFFIFILFLRFYEVILAFTPSTIDRSLESLSALCIQDTVSRKIEKKQQFSFSPRFRASLAARM